MLLIKAGVRQYQVQNDPHWFQLWRYRFFPMRHTSGWLAMSIDICVLCADGILEPSFLFIQSINFKRYLHFMTTRFIPGVLYENWIQCFRRVELLYIQQKTLWPCSEITMIIMSMHTVKNLYYFLERHSTDFIENGYLAALWRIFIG